jgi:hypothetical protein
VIRLRQAGGPVSFDFRVVFFNLCTRNNKVEAQPAKKRRTRFLGGKGKRVDAKTPFFLNDGEQDWPGEGEWERDLRERAEGAGGDGFVLSSGGGGGGSGGSSSGSGVV